MNDTEARAQAVLDAARDFHDPSPDDRERVRAALSVALAPAAAAGVGATLGEAAAHAADIPTTVMTLSTKLIIGGTLIGATGLGTGYWALADSAPAAPPSPAIEAAPRSLPASPSPRDAPVSPTPEAVPADPAEPVVDQPAPRAPAAAVAPSAGDEASGTSLAQELALLRQAQQALRTSQAERSLALLDEMNERHPNGSMGEEAAAARVLALCGAGRVAEARAQAERFLGAYPGSVLTQRVRSSCALAASPETDSSRRGQSEGRLETDGPQRKATP